MAAKNPAAFRFKTVCPRKKHALRIDRNVYPGRSDSRTEYSDILAKAAKTSHQFADTDKSVAFMVLTGPRSDEIG